MTTQHTPGPWHRNIPPATKYTTVWSGRNTHVAYVSPTGLNSEEVEANINLVTAAPDLLAALEGLMACVTIEDDRAVIHMATLSPEVRACGAAIAKARGQS